LEWKEGGVEKTRERGGCGEEREEKGVWRERGIKGGSDADVSN
jgi:hypothetical protein